MAKEDGIKDFVEMMAAGLNPGNLDHHQDAFGHLRCWVTHDTAVNIAISALGIKKSLKSIYS